MENAKPKFSNLFMHGITQGFRAWSDIERINVIGHDWYQISMKRLKNICMKIQYSLHQCKRFFDPIFNPNHSNTYTHENPKAKHMKAAPETKRKVWVFA